MANTVYTESVITLNASQAEATLNALKSSADELRKKMIDATRIGDADQAAKYQKQLDSVNRSMSSIRKETKDYSAIMERLNGSTLNELAKAYTNINRQLKNLVPGTQDFINKTNQLRQVKARMDEINTSVRGVDKTLGGLSAMLPKIGIAGVFAAAGKAVADFARTAVAQTHTVGDMWGHFTYTATNVYNAFVANLTSGKGWKELITNMLSAAKVGKEVALMLDEVFELNNSLAIKEAEYRVEIERNKQVMRDVTKTDQERILAAERVIELEREIASMKKTVAEQEMQSAKMLLQDRTKMTDAELEAYIAEYNKNRQVILQAQDYAAQVAALEKQIQNLNIQALQDSTGQTMDELKAAQQELARLRASASEEVKQWAEVDAKYQLSNDEMINNYISAREELTRADAEFYSATTRAATTLATLRRDLAKEHLAQTQQAYNDEIAGVESWSKQSQLAVKEAYAAGELSEEQYQARLTQIQEQGLRSKMAIAARYQRETVDYQTQLLDLTIKNQEEFRKVLESGETSFADSYKAILDILKDQEDEAQGIIDDEMESWGDHLVNLLEIADKLRDSLNPKAALGRDMQSELDTLDELYQYKLISEEEYQKARRRIIRKYTGENMEMDLDVWMEGMDNAMSYLYEAGNAVSALQEAELARLEARMQAELTAAGDNAEERERIESEYEEKKLATQKKYAVADMVINIAKTVAAGALAVMQAFAQLGPIAGGVMAALIGVTTAAEVATIVAQKNAIMNTSAGSSGYSTSGARIPTGYATGGYTSSSANDYTEVGVVHANEWVAPAAMVRANPIVFRRLEMARQRGGHVSGVAGFADGGMTSSTTVQQVTTTGTAIPTDVIYRLTTLLESINDRGVRAYVVLSDINGAQALDDTFKSVTSKKSKQ